MKDVCLIPDIESETFQTGIGNVEYGRKGLPQEVS